MADQKKDQFYLWHLEKTGLISPGTDGWAAPLWKDAENRAPVKVAILDTGIDTGHPNISDALAAPQIDFQTRLNGAVYDPVTPLIAAVKEALDSVQPGSAKASEIVAEACAQLKRLAYGLIDLTKLEEKAVATAAAAGTGAQAAEVDAFKAELPNNFALANLLLPSVADAMTAIEDLALAADPEGKVKAAATAVINDVETLELEDPSRYFGAHGTSAAGIVGGRPSSAPPPQHPFYSAMPYYGANPFCQILSYATPYSHEIKPCINALIAAYLSGAKVIYIPRGLPDIAHRASIQLSKSRATRIDDPGDTTVVVDEDQAKYERLFADGELFDALLKAISKKCYVVLAAGNEAFPDRVSYPASAQLEDDAHAADQQAIIVGAMNFDGISSAYTNGTDLKNRLLFVFSDDSFALDRSKASIDFTTREGSDFDYTPHYPPGKTNTFSPWAPLSLDVRGSYGYAASSNIDPPESDTGIDRGSLYTLFGGTSAASALAAGVIALLVQAGKLSDGAPDNLAKIKQVMTAEGLTHG
ncbi:MAG: S8 family serine peptidase [Pseudomonadota bacterium]